MRHLVLIFVLLGTGLAQSVPKAPSPKKFWLLAGAHVLVTGGMVYTYHDGARQCQAEDNRAGLGKYFGTSDGLGRRPDNKRVLIPAAIILAGSVAAHFRHHEKVAEETLEVYSIGQGAVAVTVFWTGCN